MNIRTLENLLSQDEGPNLEFKSRIDLGNKASKRKFLQEMLALANSTNEEPAYLIIGVEDKTKQPVGFTNITEEQLQQVVSEYCTPPILFSFKTIKYHDVPLGVVRIEPSEFKPHTMKRNLGFQDPDDGKQHKIRDNEVFVRHGSRIEVAAVEEVIKMAQARSGQTELAGKILGQLHQLGSSLKDIAEILYARDNEEYYKQLQSGDTPKSRRLIESAFVGLLTGSFVSWQWGADPALIFPTCLLVCFTGSAIKIIHYSLLEILGYGFLISIVTNGLFLLGKWKNFLPMLMETSDSVVRAFTGAFIGMVGGLIAAIWVDRARI